MENFGMPNGQNQSPAVPQAVEAPSAYRAVPTTNGTAIAALVCSLLFAPLGIILGHIARRQIKRSGESGHGLATAGMIIGYILTFVPILLGIILALLIFTDFAGDNQAYTGVVFLAQLAATPLMGFCA